MLEIRRGTATKNYENTFFRKFAENLEKLFDKYSIDGLLIANSECEAEKRLQIDALLVTENVVCIIDFPCLFLCIIEIFRLFSGITFYVKS